MIKRELINRLAPHLALGEERKYNHEGCRAGEDTKKRLYIKRVVGGKLAYCHHCNEHGFVRDLDSDGIRLRKWLLTDTTSSEPTRVVREYSSMFSKMQDITDPVLLTWCTLHHVRIPNDNYFRQSDKKELLFLLRNLAGSVSGYQARSFIPGKPKYTTHLITNLEVSWFGFKYPVRAVVITEDYTSAFRVWYDNGISTLALLKTSISNNTLNELIGMSPSRIFVWLDPDEPGQAASKKLVARLNVVMPASTEVIAIHQEEPKNLTPEQVRKVFHGL